MDIKVGPWAPDTPDFENTGSTEALNVTPNADSYGPFPSFAAISNALTARCQGAFFARKSDGSGVIFAGDATKLYRLSATTFSDVSRLAGGAYTCASDQMWDFIQFGSLIYAFNGTDAPQQFDVDSDANFSAMTGSPPTPTYVTVAGDFVMTLNQFAAGFPQRIQWGPINQNGTWAQSQVTMSDQQDLPDGGRGQGLIGFDQSVYIFQEFCIRRGTFVGTPLIWQFGKIADNIGATIPGSIAPYKERVFFVDRSGFYMLMYGTLVQPIGTQRVNNWFWDNLDQNYMVRVTSAIDPANNIYAIAFPDLTNTNGTPNHILIYEWAVDRWSHVQAGNLEMIYSGATQSGFTIEGLDVFGTIENVPFPFDSTVWTGLARRLISGFGTDHKLGFFSGPALAPTVDTTEANIIKGKRAFLRSCRPIVDGGTPSVTLGTRDRINDAVTFGAARAVDAYGNCKFRTPARYHRGRITLPAGSTFSHIQGIDQIVAVPFGTR